MKQDQITCSALHGTLIDFKSLLIQLSNNRNRSEFKKKNCNSYIYLKVICVRDYQFENRMSDFLK